MSPSSGGHRQSLASFHCDRDNWQRDPNEVLVVAVVANWSSQLPLPYSWKNIVHKKRAEIGAMNQNASGNERVVLSTMVGKRLLALVD
jgi:hypothetical protein